MEFSYTFKGRKMPGAVEIIKNSGDRDDRKAYYLVEADGKTTVLFMDVDDSNAAGDLLWHQRTAAGAEPWPDDLVQAIGKAVLRVDFDPDPDALVVGFTQNDTEFSAEIVKQGEEYKLMAHHLPGVRNSDSNFTLVRIGSKRAGFWSLKNQTDIPDWVVKLGREIDRHEQSR